MSPGPVFGIDVRAAVGGTTPPELGLLGVGVGELVGGVGLGVGVLPDEEPLLELEPFVGWFEVFCDFWVSDCVCVVVGVVFLCVTLRYTQRPARNRAAIMATVTSSVPIASSHATQVRSRFSA